MTIDRFQTGPRMSKIVRHAGLIFLSGQTANGTTLSDISSQTKEVLRRIDELLAEAGSDRSHLLTATVYLRDIGDFAAMNLEWEAWLAHASAPARTTVEARLASPNLLVEVTVTAARMRD
ncbi:RidA family protein [Bosea sp. (in: a-proteobacteria)]|jgi:enamine deaminase RidA (YjgF/YER057c/UK114 family)|uniref:RidA family protein n=1 Tax=Bosea sp. (in: a-proteobacteria) TaxID=1871050 RepID=UPI002DDD2E11|nr:RidA family protein [Bosea sp. (in: a-proteobacteria)]HEV2508313.1 RidA family protein [Bosea sp. (in: a-proteobacteria)]